MATKRISGLDPVVTKTGTMFMAIEDSSNGNLTRKLSNEELVDVQTIKVSPSGEFYVDQTQLNSLTGVVTTTGNKVKVSINGGADSAESDILTTFTFTSTANIMSLDLNGTTINANPITTFTFGKPLNPNGIEININGTAFSLNAISTFSGSYLSGTLAFSANGFGSNNLTVDGTSIPVVNPVIAGTSTLNTALADINNNNSVLSPVIFSGTNITITTQRLLYFTGTSSTIATLPDATTTLHPIEIWNDSSNNSNLNVSPTIGLSPAQNINGTSGVYCIKRYQRFKFLSNGVNWYTTGTETSGKSNLLFVSSNTFPGGTATYAFNFTYGDGNFVYTIKNNVATLYFVLDVTIGGTPSAPLTTNFDFVTLIGANGFGSLSNATGYSKLSTTIITPRVTDEFYSFFYPKNLTTAISAQTNFIPVAGTYTMNVGIQFLTS